MAFDLSVRAKDVTTRSVRVSGNRLYPVVSFGVDLDWRPSGYDADAAAELLAVARTLVAAAREIAPNDPDVRITAAALRLAAKGDER